jgi:hypothetical protein
MGTRLGTESRADPNRDPGTEKSLRSPAVSDHPRWGTTFYYATPLFADELDLRLEDAGGM